MTDATSAPAGESAQTVVLEGTFSPAEAAAEVYRYLPFTVPPRTRRIDVAYQVRPLDPVAAGKPVVTIGIFDTREAFGEICNRRQRLFRPIKEGRMAAVFENDTLKG